MKQILCFGDSNTYGLIPEEGGRYPWRIRWTSILNEKLGLENYRPVEIVDKPNKFGCEVCEAGSPLALDNG